jgi:DNA-binding SARP family transcriptional activator
MCSRIPSITVSSVSPRATYPHSHRIDLAIGTASVLTHPVVRRHYCHNVGVTLAPGPLTRIQLCGPLVIERGAERLEDGLPGRQGRLLFTYLALHRHRPARRDELVEALWPDQAPSAVATALNPLISKLRRCVGADVLDGRSTLRLLLGDTWIDLEAATEAIHRAETSVAQHDWKRAWGPAQVALFVAERDFLPGEDAPWIDEQRRRLADIRTRALECYGVAALGLGGTELAAAVRAGRQLVRLAPLRESGHRCLMEALAAQGNVAESLRVYTDLCALLRDELGVLPSPPTRDLHGRLLLTDTI